MTLNNETFENLDRDIDDIGKTTSTKQVITPRYGDPYKSFPLIAQELAENGMFKPFATEALLRAYVPVIIPTAAKALDTKKVWIYEQRAGESVPSWHDTGLSELELAIANSNSNPLFKPAQLSADMDLNSIKKSGVYIAQNAIPTLLKNYPTTKAGVLTAHEVLTGSTGTLIPQSYMTFDGEVYRRGTNQAGNAYTAWEQSSTKALIQQWSNEVTVTTTPLNDLVQNGRYIVYSTDPIATTNHPESGKQWIVDHYVSNSVKRQVAYDRGSNRIETRSFWGSNGWTAWERLATVNDVTTAKNEVLTALDKKVDPLNEFRKNLFNKLNGFNSVRLKLVGDSITWGANASNASSTVPRDKTMNDARNTTDPISPSWANLLRKYIAYTFGDTSITEDRPGSAYTKRKKTISIKDHIKSFSFKTASGVAVSESVALQVITDNASAKNGETMNLLGANFVANRQNEFSFDIVADNVSILYSAWSLGDENNVCEVYVDGVKAGQFNYYSATQTFDNEFTTSFTYGKHTIRVKNIATHASSYALIQCCATEQKVWVINEGINGSYTGDWITRGLMSATVNPYDDFVLMQLGTNDRGTKGVSAFKSRLKTCVDLINSLSNNNAKILLLTSVPDSPTNALNPAYFFNMQTVDTVISSVAIELNLAHVSQYKHANQYVIDGTVIWADGLHPNDFGYKIMYENLRNQIFKV